MLMPQFSLRWVLAVTAVAGVLSLVAAMARQGAAWATALTIAMGSLGLVALIHAAMFFVTWVFSLVAPQSRRSVSGRSETPFAAAVPPLPGEAASAAGAASYGPETPRPAERIH